MQICLHVNFCCSDESLLNTTAFVFCTQVFCLCGRKITLFRQSDSRNPARSLKFMMASFLLENFLQNIVLCPLIFSMQTHHMQSDWKTVIQREWSCIHWVKAWKSLLQKPECFHAELNQISPPLVGHLAAKRLNQGKTPSSAQVMMTAVPTEGGILPWWLQNSVRFKLAFGSSWL